MINIAGSVFLSKCYQMIITETDADTVTLTLSKAQTLWTFYANPQLWMGYDLLVIECSAYVCVTSFIPSRYFVTMERPDISQLKSRLFQDTEKQQ